MGRTATREALRRRPDVPNENIEDIIARAAELQDAARAHARNHATVEEVERVAEELDIAPAYVERAIHALRDERRATTVAQQATARNRSQRIRLAGLALVGLGLILGGSTVGAALLGSSRLSAAAIGVELTAAKLTQALDRQTALAPQLVALAGGNTEAVKVASENARSAEGVASRLEAAEALNLAMAEAIGQIEARGSEQAQQRLLNLQHEVVGTWNRIDTERGRYDEAVTTWTHGANALTGRLALTLGLASTPSELRSNGGR